MCPAHPLHRAPHPQSHPHRPKASLARPRTHTQRCSIIMGSSPAKKRRASTLSHGKFVSKRLPRPRGVGSGAAAREACTPARPAATKGGKRDKASRKSGAAGTASATKMPPPNLMPSRRLLSGVSGKVVHTRSRRPATRSASPHHVQRRQIERGVVLDRPAARSRPARVRRRRAPPRAWARTTSRPSKPAPCAAAPPRQAPWAQQGARDTSDASVAAGGSADALGSGLAVGTKGEGERGGAGRAAAPEADLPPVKAATHADAVAGPRGAGSAAPAAVMAATAPGPDARRGRP
jgi:hypothetical protein